MGPAESTKSRQQLEFRLLGTFEVVSGDRRLAIGSGKQRALLAMLALRLNDVVPGDELVDQLWGETPPASATASLYSLVSLVRRTLARCHSADGGVNLQTRDPGYVLEGDPDCVDASRFERLAAEARHNLGRGEPEMAAQALRHALGLWRGRALADLSDVRAVHQEADRLEEARLGAVEDLADAELACGRPDEALAHLHRHVDEHPFRERATGQMMLSLYRLGRQADALALYRRARGTIVEELGVEPTPALRRLEEQILHQSSELDGPGAAHAAGATPARPGAPDDTIAFLFTDIEASTRRWEGNTEAMALDLARHDELLRVAVAGVRGEVFTHTGDGLAAAFSTASAALAAAVAGQRALLEERWAAGPLRVRMAVHAGRAERRGGSYFGPTLNRAGRLMATGHGGQVLCSGAAADLARDDLPEGVSLLDLGEHNLTDLTRPERIFQLAAPGLQAEFPPLRSRDAPRHNLPVSLTPFVGRAAELQELRGLLLNTRLLTLTGVGGSGKTRLSVELGGMVVQAFREGVWLAELGSLQDPARVADEVCTAVGVASEGLLGRSESPEERLCAHLQRRHVLIILDNCEHLVEASARLVQTVLTRCPDVRIVATSREVLGVPGEVTWNVPPLSLPPADPGGAEDLAGSDAVALFCNRAHAAQPGFAASTANAPAVAQICRRLDGIPLALELAAARIRVLSAQQIAERLDDRFRLLVAGDRTVVPRHQTLSAAIDWSFTGLPAPEQAVLSRLAVFPDSFDLDAAVAVATDGTNVAVAGAPGFAILDLLARLVDKSLVTVLPREDGDRYRLLETVRQYAAERLAEAGETLAAQHRHRDHFVSLADGPAFGWWREDILQRSEVDETNFIAALEWSLEQGEFEPALRLAAFMYGYWYYAGAPQSAERLERVLAGADRSATRDRVVATIGLAVLLSLSSRSDRDRSERLLQEALEMADRLDFGPGQAAARSNLAFVALIRGDTDRALRLEREALATGVQGIVRAECLYGLSCTEIASGDVQGAMRSLEEGLDIARRGFNRLLTPHFLAALAPLAAMTGDSKRAEALAEEAVQSSAPLRLPAIRVMSLTRACEARILTGDTSRARATLRQLLELLRDLGGRRFVADALEMAALVAEQEGRSAVTARLLAACRAMREADGEPFGGTRTVSPLVRACDQRVHESLGAAEYENVGHGLQTTSVAIEYALAHLSSEGDTL